MSERVIASVQQGDLRGQKVITKSGLHYYSFQGIPYAKPPVGNLRFKVSYNSASCLHFKVIPGTACNRMC
jgi:carboxylesterase type B